MVATTNQRIFDKADDENEEDYNLPHTKARKPHHKRHKSSTPPGYDRKRLADNLPEEAAGADMIQAT